MKILFINTYKDLFGVEPICRVLSEHLDGGFITASGYYRAIGRVASARSLSDQLLIPELKRIHQENYGVYGVRKMWQAMRRAGWAVGRDQTYRLMRAAGLQGVHRRRKPVTTRPATVLDHRPDLVNRRFTADAPNRLWVADFTYVRTAGGFCYTAFITDVFSRKSVGWATRSSMKTEALPLQALEQAIALAKQDLDRLIHHRDHGSQYVSIAYNEKLTYYGIRPSTGTVGDSYDNTLAETVNGLYKSELIYSQSWASLMDLEFATLNWAHWYNTQRLNEAIDYHTPAEIEQIYNAKLATSRPESVATT